MIVDYESFLNKNNIKKISDEISDFIRENLTFEKKVRDVLKNNIDSSEDIGKDMRKYLSEFNKNFYNSVSLLKKENGEKIINIDELYVFINFIKTIDEFCVGPMTQKLHNILLKHIAYYIANMTDGYARKIYRSLYGI